MSSRAWPDNPSGRRCGTGSDSSQPVPIPTQDASTIQAMTDWGWRMDVAEREQQVRNFVEKVWNARSYEAASELFSEKYVNPF